MGTGSFVLSCITLCKPAKIVSRAVFRGENKMKILAFLILCFASVAFGDDFKAINGKEYKNVKVSRVEPDGIVLVSKSGISKVYFTELPKEVQERFHYDPTKAAQFITATQAATAQSNAAAAAVATEKAKQESLLHVQKYRIQG